MDLITALLTLEWGSAGLRYWCFCCYPGLWHVCCQKGHSPLPHCVSRLDNIVINPGEGIRFNGIWVFDRLIILRYKTNMQKKTNY
jgi:hypothetical protein